jgi:hypothetical protein
MIRSIASRVHTSQGWAYGLFSEWSTPEVEAEKNLRVNSPSTSARGFE